MMLKGFSVAIDGPVASGKGTIAPLLAKKLNGFYLYTGAMYRSLTLLCIEKGIDVYDKEAVLKVLSDFNIWLENSKVFLNNKDVTERLKKEDVVRKVPIVSLYPEVRKVMVRKQQEIAEKMMGDGKIVIAEGRDAGTKIFPDAHIKIFLTARVEVRAKRRLLQLKDQGLSNTTYEEVLEQTKKRDKTDMERKADPLVSKPHEHGYFIVDNSDQSESETIQIILSEMRKRGLVSDKL